MCSESSLQTIARIWHVFLNLWTWTDMNMKSGPHLQFFSLLLQFSLVVILKRYGLVWGLWKCVWTYFLLKAIPFRIWKLYEFNESIAVFTKKKSNFVVLNENDYISLPDFSQHLPPKRHFLVFLRAIMRNSPQEKRFCLRNITVNSRIKLNWLS